MSNKYRSAFSSPSMHFRLSWSLGQRGLRKKKVPGPSLGDTSVLWNEGPRTPPSCLSQRPWTGQYYSSRSLWVHICSRGCMLGRGTIKKTTTKDFQQWGNTEGGKVLKIKIASYFSQMGPKSFFYILPTSNYLVFSFLQRECYRNHLSFSSRRWWL